MLGDTAGRSQRHPTGSGAVARSTARQRAYQAPPPGQEWVTVHTKERYRAMATREIATSAVLVLLGTLIMLAADRPQLEAIGLAPVLLAVTLAGVSRPWRWIRTDLVLEDRTESQIVTRR